MVAIGTQPAAPGHELGVGDRLWGMASFSDALLLAFATLLAIVLFLKRAAIKEALENFNSRGGPTPMHPSPAGDDSLLRPNSRKRAAQS